MNSQSATDDSFHETNEFAKGWKLSPHFDDFQRIPTEAMTVMGRYKAMVVS